MPEPSRSETEHHDHPRAAVPLTAKVLTVSDGVAAGVREDRGGAAVRSLLSENGFEVIEQRVIPDGVNEVANALTYMAYGYNGLVVTTGGTGFGPRDATPEATKRILDRTAPGLAEAMRAANPLGRLSRNIAGTRGRALIINTPGSPSGAVEMLEAVLDVVPHAIELMAGHDALHPTHEH